MSGFRSISTSLSRARWTASAKVAQLSGDLHALFHVTFDEAGGLHVVVSNNPQGVSAETLQQLKAHFSDAEISELTVTIGLWNALTRFHRVMDLELDMPEPPPELDAAL